MPSTIQVLLVHPSTLLRVGLRHIITIDSNMRVCGEAATLAQGRESQTAKRPQLIVVDPEMEKDAGFPFMTEIQRPDSDVRCVAVGGRLGRAGIERAFKAGAVAVLSHYDSEKAILQGLYAALNGTRHMSPSVTEDFCSEMDGGMMVAANPSVLLSPREKEIFGLIGQGLRIKQVAAQAGMSARTVESHEANIKKKLGLRDNSQLRRLAILWVERQEAAERLAA